uniref:Uncharacterized protein n=1 Tax=Sphaerodactylus townsendi TaxID=933632 RepID=A0ACB8F5A8_9SAUR
MLKNIHTEGVAEAKSNLKFVTALCCNRGIRRTVGIPTSSCPVPESLIYAVPKPEEVTKNYYTPGTTVTYVCRRGYDSIPGMSPVITCLQNNSWSEVPIFCRGKSCGDPGKPENGRVVIVTDLLYRSKVNFICDDGYQLIGSPFTQCSMKSNAAKWDKEPPDCQHRGKSDSELLE